MMDAIWREAPIDVLVNNAAATFIAQTEQLSFRAADAILAPTLHGTMYCTLAAGKRWIDGKHKGVVLSILSTSTITGRAFTVPSAMAKSAILALTKSLAVEWGPKGIRTVAIAPGAFPTPGATGQLRPEGRDSNWAARNPLGRAGEHRELADLASYLISDGAGLYQWRDGRAGRRRASALVGRRGFAAMDRRAMGGAAHCTRQKLIAPACHGRNAGPSSSHNDGGTTPHVSADFGEFCGKSTAVRGHKLRAGAECCTERCAEGRPRARPNRPRQPSRPRQLAAAPSRR